MQTINEVWHCSPADTGFYELFLDSDTIGDVTGTYTFGVGRYNRTLAVVGHPWT